MIYWRSLKNTIQLSKYPDAYFEYRAYAYQ